MAILAQPQITRGDRQRLPSWDDTDWFELTDEDGDPYDLTDRTVNLALVIKRTNERIDLSNSTEVHEDPTTGQVAIVLEESDTAVPIDGNSETLYGEFRLEGNAQDPTTAGSFKLTVYPSRHNIEVGATLLPYSESFGSWAENGIMDAEGARISNLSDPEADQDAVNQRTLETELGALGEFDHTFTDAVDAQGNDLQNVGAFDAQGIDLSGGVADPMNHGAVGDGTTDDAAAFQAACDAVAPDGTVIYHQDHQLNAPVDSGGADVVSLGGTIYADPNATYDQYQIGYDSNDIALLYSDGHDDVTFSVRVDGREQYVAGAALWHGSDLVFSGCHIVDCANSGLQFMGNREIGLPAVANSEMRGNYVEGCMWNYVVDGEGHGISLKGNRSRDAHARHASFDPGEAAENITQTNISLSDTECEGHKPLPTEWEGIPGPSGQDYAVRPLDGVELRADSVVVSDWGNVGLGTTAADVTLTTMNYTFRNEVGDTKGTALYVPRGPVTVVESMTAYRAGDGFNLFVADDQGGHVSIRNCTFIDCGGTFNNAPDTIPADWVLEGNYNQNGTEVSP